MRDAIFCSWTTLFISLVVCGFVGARDVVLFDMATHPTESWDQLPLRHEGEQVWDVETWRGSDNEESNRNHNQRAFVACNYELVNPSNWLFSNPIKVEDAKLIHIELKFNMRDCAQYVDPKSCKETFSIYGKQYTSETPGNADLQRKQFERTQDTWKKLSVLSRKQPNMTTETVSMVLANGTQSMRFAFEENGACLSILSIRVYYNVCDPFVVGLVQFPEVFPAKARDDPITVIGKCVANSVPKFPGVDLKSLCMISGKTIHTSGECECIAGHESNDNKTCKACPVDTFKPQGAGPCLRCPMNSRSDSTSNAFCICEDDFYRADDEDKNVACTKPPSRPIILKQSDLTSESVRLSWEEPKDLGGRKEIWYELECRSSASACATIRTNPPDSRRLLSRTVVVSHLAPDTEYQFTIYSRNKVSAQSREVSYAVLDVLTKSILEDVAPVVGLRVDADQNDGVTIAWSSMDNSVREFEVEISPAASGRRLFETVRVNVAYHTFMGLKRGIAYTFRVRAINDSRWSQPLHYELGKGMMRKSSSPSETSEMLTSNLFSYMLIAVVIVLVCISAALCFMLRRRSRNRKQMSDLDVLDTYKQDSMTPDYHTTSRHMNANAAHLHEQLRSGAKLHAPLIPNFGSPMSQPPPYYGGPASGKYRAYVDPTAYEDPNQALNEFAFDIDPNDVFITQIIGGGEFGDVCLGGLRTSSNAASRFGTVPRIFDNDQFEQVAIKTLKSGSSPKAKSEFLVEASIMGQFSHPNVIRLIGVVTSSEPIMIVTEYMSNGSLDHFMRSRDSRGEKLAWEKITEMLYGIASGMKYLTDMGYVHRDLAARNVLVDGELRCKIADFGLSRGVEGSAEQEYTTNGGKIPVRWTAPEAITHRKFTAASDVWSFGVVIWEVCSYGERPYWDWTNQKVISEIMIGYRLPAPMDSPPGLHRVSQWCWRMERHERPTFAQLVAVLHKYILQPHLIHADPGDLPRKSLSTVNLNTYGSISTVPTPPSSAPPSPSLDEFLRSIGLHHCYGQLMSANIQSVGDLARKSHLDLLACGLISHECSAIRDALFSSRLAPQLPPTPPGTATLPHPGGSLRGAMRIANATVRRDEGFFV